MRFVLTLLLIFVFYCLSWLYDPDLLDKYGRWVELDLRLNHAELLAKGDMLALQANNFWNSNPSDLEILRHQVLGALRLVYGVFLVMIWPIHKYLFIPLALIFAAAWLCVGIFYKK